MTTVDTPMSFLPQGDKRTVPGALPRVSTGTLQTSTHLGTTVICLSGDHDLTNAADLSEAIERAVIDADVIVDLNGADFIDSSILHALTRGHRAAAAAGRYLRIRLPADHHLSRLLDISPIGVRVIERYDVTDAPPTTAASRQVA